MRQAARRTTSRRVPEEAAAGAEDPQAGGVDTERPQGVDHGAEDVAAETEAPGAASAARSPEGFGFIIKESPIQGLGCFAAVDYQEEQLIGLYTGWVVDGGHALARDPHFMWVDGVEMSDGTEVGWGILGTGLLRYCNHSHDPNVDVEGLLFFANRDIKAGVELTIEYGEDWDLDEE